MIVVLSVKLRAGRTTSKVFNSLLTGGYEFDSTATAILGEPFGVIVDVSQFLTATHADEPTVTIVTGYRIDPQSETILEASVSSQLDPGISQFERLRVP